MAHPSSKAKRDPLRRRKHEGIPIKCYRILQKLDEHKSKLLPVSLEIVPHYRGHSERGSTNNSADNTFVVVSQEEKQRSVYKSSFRSKKKGGGII